jgi:hypothetical protein
MGALMLVHGLATRAGEVVPLDTDHSPFMSSPEEFADLLDGIADKATAYHPQGMRRANDDVTRSTC